MLVFGVEIKKAWKEPVPEDGPVRGDHILYLDHFLHGSIHLLEKVVPVRENV